MPCRECRAENAVQRMPVTSSPQKCEEVLQWLDNNTLAEKDECEHQLQEMQKVCSPITTKIYQQGASAGEQGHAGGAGAAGGPTVEEVD